MLLLRKSSISRDCTVSNILGNALKMDVTNAPKRQNSAGTTTAACAGDLEIFQQPQSGSNAAPQ